MKQIALLHWKPDEIAELARRIQGFRVAPVAPRPGESLKDLERIEAEAVVICLDRMPSNGRAVGYHLRTRKATRHIPIIFVGGEPDKVQKARELLPDATFASWASVSKAVTKAIAEASTTPTKAPIHVGNPLHIKLGLKPGMKIAVLGAPKPFDTIVRDLPEGIEMTEELDRDADVAYWFVRSLSELELGIHWFESRMPKAKFWILWKRGASKIPDAVSYASLVEIAAGAGYAQYKIVRVDDVWSAAIFGYKRTA